jgi:septum formation protein
MKQLILASASPRRAELLKQIGLKFRVIPSNIQEDFYHTDPEELVMKLALDKARQVARSVSEGLVIGADTIVVFERHVLGKPSGPEDAIRMLSILNGREHSVFTGLALVEVPGERFTVTFEETKVKFRTLDIEEIRSYATSREPLDKAGAYGIQGKGAVLVEGITGCYFNVVGLPVSKLITKLQEFGISVWSRT